MDRDEMNQPQMRYRNEDGLLIADPPSLEEMSPEERARFEARRDRIKALLDSWDEAKGSSQA
ncbi:hypothetical protein [Streptosporangium saharense]|uniref:Uncharacterized protein n=1 Tax=Streptosporangium saharense TaxID=1706840 RepID=A0A7W7VLW2_9ACTN|nr:hypothetical protein [Streptosporangium saharense]MBB4915087.1 hypothetical protein [Streptosporangium saharense]